MFKVAGRLLLATSIDTTVTAAATTVAITATTTDAVNCLREWRSGRQG